MKVRVLVVCSCGCITVCGNSRLHDRNQPFFMEMAKVHFHMVGFPLICIQLSILFGSSVVLVLWIWLQHHVLPSLKQMWPLTVFLSFGSFLTVQSFTQSDKLLAAAASIIWVKSLTIHFNQNTGIIFQHSNLDSLLPSGPLFHPLVQIFQNSWVLMIL